MIETTQFGLPHLPKGFEAALLSARWQRDVLVGCLRDRGQLRISLRHRFYHMPASRFEGDPTEIRFVAIYQSQSLFGRWGGVRYYGRVTGCETVLRKEITQIPRDSDDLYLRFAVDRWQKLPRKIACKEIPLTHMRTTQFLLLSSRQTPELYLEDERQFRLYHGLKKLLGCPRIRTSGFRFEDSAVVLKSGEICTLQDGKLIPTYLREHFVETPFLVFRHILNKISQKERPVILE